MSFDINNAAWVAALQNELAGDPLAMGYSTIVNNNQMVDLLNDPAANLSGATTATELTVGLLIESIDATEFVGDTGQNFGNFREFLKMITASRPFDLSIEQYKAKIMASINNGGPTWAALNSLSRRISRIEEITAVGIVLTKPEYIDFLALP